MSPRGYTLIELLAVVAVVGVLSAIVLASLTVAHNKADDAAVEGNLRAILVQAKEFKEANNGRYNTDGTSGVEEVPYECPIASPNATMFYADSVIRSAIIYAGAASGSRPQCYLSHDGTKFSVHAPLKTGGYWCIDSTGTSTFSSAIDMNNSLCASP